MMLETQNFGKTDKLKTPFLIHNEMVFFYAFLSLRAKRSEVKQSSTIIHNP